MTHRNIVSLFFAAVLILSLFVIASPSASAQSDTLTFATVGDYGVESENKAAVAAMIASWNPDLIIGRGDGYLSQAGGVGSEKYDFSTGPNPDSHTDKHSVPDRDSDDDQPTRRRIVL